MRIEHTLIEGTAGCGATYQFAKDATSNLRQKDDSYSEAIAGFLSGSCIGIYSVYCQSSHPTTTNNR
jgi:hypothetical protein